MNEILVGSRDELADCCAKLALCRRFGFDTEFVGEESYHPRLCLVQVATADALYLIDPLALDSLGPFWELVVDPANQVVVHAGREEVRLCHIWSGQTPGNLFDLQIAAGLVGLPYPLGHGPLVYHVLGKKLTKGETLTEWRTRPLTNDQIRYAFDDVRYLLPIAESLTQRLDKLHRASWRWRNLPGSASSRRPMRMVWRSVPTSGATARRRLPGASPTGDSKGDFLLA